MVQSMSNFTLNKLNEDTINALRHHNLLINLVRSIAIEEAVIEIDIYQESSNTKLDSYLEKQNIFDDVALEQHLALKGLNAESLRWQLELPERIAKYSYKKFKHKAEARFLEIKETLDTVIYSLLRVKDGFLARELYFRISQGEEDFASLAAKYSEGPEANTNGIVGPVSMKKSHPALTERLRTSRPHELLEPFNINEWWLVARLEQYQPAKFEEATALAITKELFYEWIEEQVQCRISSL